MKKETGFTMIELMLTVTIAAILMAVALPNYREMVKNNCLTNSTNALVASLQQARSEAVKRSTDVTLTASNAGDTTNEWGTGWTITLDEDRDGDGVMDTGEDFNGNGTLDAAALVRSVTLSCDGTTMDETSDDTAFIYQSDGFIDAPATLDICDDRTGETGRQIDISRTGRPSTDSQYTGCL